MANNNQTKLFEGATQKYEGIKLRKSDSRIDIPIKYINLRQINKEHVASTTYLTHGIHNVYPAKFIPQVPRFFIEFYKIKNKTVFDPFAGSGTTAVECLVTGNNNISNDFNPLTCFLIDIKTMIVDLKKYQAYLNEIETVVRSINDKYQFEPCWGNINYWYDAKVLSDLKTIWGGIHYNTISEDIRQILKAAALFVSRKYSFAENDSPKLFISKMKRSKIPNILGDYRAFGKGVLLKSLRDKAVEYCNSIFRFNEYVKEIGYNLNRAEKDKKLKIMNSSLDLLPSLIPSESIDAIITSPPYIYAQEYIRSTKIDLYWLGLANDNIIRELTKSEIGQKTKPFTKVRPDISRIPSLAENLNVIIDKVSKFKTRSNVKRFLSYFEDIYYFIEVSRNVLKKDGLLGIFIGEPKVFGVPVRTATIIIEMLDSKGFRVKDIFFDEIKGRHLSKQRLNENPDGITGEWLIVGEKL